MAAVKFIFVLVAAFLLSFDVNSADDPTPEELKEARNLILKRAGDSSHWCCKDDITPKVVHTTRPEVQRYITHDNYTYVSAYKPCAKEHDHNETWSYCKVYKTEIVDVPMYRIVQVDLVHTETPVCPEKSLVCCEGHTLFMGNCYEPDKLATIKKLIDSGLVG